MNRLPWIRKELRQLLPLFVTGVVLLLIAWTQFSKNGFNRDSLLITGPLSLCPIIALLLCIASFGRELSGDTFRILFDLPISRHRIWWTKVFVLSLYLGVFWWGWWTTFTQLHLHPDEADLKPMVQSMTFAACAFSGGLLWTIVLRRVGAAFWISLLAPCALIWITARVIPETGSNPDAVIDSVLRAYSAIGFIVGYRLFVTAQDPKTTHRHWLSLSIPAPLTRGYRAPVVQHARSSTWALWLKEFRSRQWAFVVAGMMLMAHLVVLAARHWGPVLPKDSGLYAIVSTFWGLWLLFPVIIGTTLFKEEKCPGFLEGRLCFPPPGSRHWRIKWLFGLGLSWCLGALLPFMLESNGLLAPNHIDLRQFDPADSAWRQAGGLYSLHATASDLVKVIPFSPRPLFVLSGFSCVLFLLAAYASSLSRSLLQSLIVSIAGIVVSLPIVSFFAEPEWMTGIRLFRGEAGLILMIPVAVICLCLLIRRNATEIWVGTHLWRHNAMVLLLVLVGSAACCTGLYHRTWEELSVLESPHGPNRLHVPTGATCLIETRGRNLIITAPDGRRWSAGLDWNFDAPEAHLGDQYRVESLTSPNKTLTGTNWSQIVVGDTDTVGIQKDGSLWVSEFPQTKPPVIQGGSVSDSSTRLTRYGTESQWKQFIHFGEVVLLLKTDGTLWHWNRPKGIKAANTTGLHTYAPRLTSKYHEWVDLRRIPHDSFGAAQLRNSEGKVWRVRWEDPRRPDYSPWLLAPLSMDVANDENDTDVIKYEETLVVGDSHFTITRFSLRTNGILHVDLERAPAYSLYWADSPSRTPVSQSDFERFAWRDIAGDDEHLIALRQDGTLWKWSSPDPDDKQPKGLRRTQLGTHSDWVAVFRLHDELVSLAQDGSLWGWQFEGFRSRHSDHVLMAPSRKPRLIGTLQTETH